MIPKIISNAETEGTNAVTIQNQYKLIKEYEKRMNLLKHSIPLKDVIYVKPIKQVQEITKHYKSQSSQGDNFKTQQCFLGVKTRSKNRYADQQQSNLSISQIPQLSWDRPPKKKFRHRSYNKLRRSKGPHQPFYYELHTNKDEMKQAEVKQERQQLFFSDASQNQEEGENNNHKQQFQRHSFSCKIQENIIPQAQKTNGKYIVTRHNLSKLYEYISIQLELALYCSQPNQDPFFEKIFHEAVADLSYKASTERSSHLLSKGRHFIVRKIMEVFAKIPPKMRQEERFVRNRLTIKERDMMIKASLPIPPPRLTTEFLTVLFQNSSFRVFFKEFIYKGNLQQVLLDRSKAQILKYDNYYKKIGCSKMSLQQKLAKLKRDPPPLSWLQIRLFMQEAYAINDKYSNNF